MINPNMSVRTNGMDIGLTETDIMAAGDIDIPDNFYNRFSTAIQVIDDLMGGFVPGCVATVSSARGVGKTTLLLQLCDAFQKATTGLKTLYLSGEEHVTQLAFTCQRLNTQSVAVANKTTVENILPLFGQFHVVVIDSLAAIGTHNPSISKHDAEVYAMQQFYKRAKETNTLVFIVLHQTKSGVAKGNSSLQHMADATIDITKLDDESFGPGARNINVDKNRFGSTGNVSLRINRSGWDFDNPIDDSQANNKDNRPTGGARAEKAAAEMNNLVEFMKQKGTIKEIDLVSWNKLPSDPTALDRFSRLLKKMVKYGKVAKVGNEFSLVP